MSIEQFNLKPELIQYLKDNKITNFSDVQEKVIPLLLKNKNVLVESPTGTGKTLAYLLPILNAIREKNHFNSVILVPTRELGEQIKLVLKDIYKYYPHFSYLITTGGNPFQTDGDKLLRKPNIVISTPERLVKLLNQYSIPLNELKTIIIDEIDMIYNFNFFDDIISFKEKIGNNKIQWSLFSATFPIQMMNFIENKLKINAINNVTINDDENKVIHINRIDSFDEDKKETLWKLLNSDIFNPYFCLIFAKSSNEVSSIYKFLKQKQMKEIIFFNNQLNASERKQNLKMIFDQRIKFLITTDLIARGMDFPGVTHIINYNYPTDLNYYKHRIGRTNRLNNVRGNIYDIVATGDQETLKKIQKKNKNLEFDKLKF